MAAILVVCTTTPQARALECRAKDSEADAAISELHPTQTAVGLGEVEKKRKELSGVDPSQGSKDDGEPVPVVVGPDGKLYVTDHHHFVLALLLATTDKALVRIKVLENGFCNTCSPSNDECVKEFWGHMAKEHLAYLSSSKAEPIRYTSLPPSFEPDASPKLQNDPFRTLVNVMRKKPPTGDDKPCLVRPADPRESYFWEFRMAERIKRQIKQKDAEELAKDFPKTTKIPQNIIDAACKAWNEDNRLDANAKSCADKIADDPSLVD